MQIFNAEIEDGLSTIISAQANISYASLAEPLHTNKNIQSKNIKVLAALNDRDLYYAQSILVTTSWNKNDDIFDKMQVWDARDTPVHKPTNLEHDENTIVGHITSNWPITDEGILIDPATPPENLPDKFHILTGSVIYVGYTDPDLRERSQKLIAEIESGNKYVSMECYFNGFDYGLINRTTGQYQILERNEETAFLTKYLRAYGGAGEHEDHKIGRVLKGITFSGKGFVNKPANPESVIFTKQNLAFNKNTYNLDLLKEKKDTFENQGVFSIQAKLKETTMSIETEVSQTEEVVETVTEVKQTEVATETVVEETVEVEVNLHEEAAKKMKEDMMKKEEEMKKMKAALENMELQLNAANETLAGYKEKEAEMMKKEKKMSRKASLLDQGVDSEIAEATVDKLESLSDEMFDTVTSLWAAKMPPFLEKIIKEKKENKKTEEESKSNIVYSSEILETAEPEDAIDLSVGSETEISEIESTRAALVDFVYNRLGKKLNKGE